MNVSNSFLHRYRYGTQIPPHWLSIETGKKIGRILGITKDVIIVEIWGKKGRHIKILDELDLSKPLVRGTKLKYKQCEIWVQFRYDQLPIVCHYCGCIGHKQRMCTKRKEDLSQNCLKDDQFGFWLRVGNGKPGSLGTKRSRLIR